MKYLYGVKSHFKKWYKCQTYMYKYKNKTWNRFGYEIKYLISSKTKENLPTLNTIAQQIIYDISLMIIRTVKPS